MSVWKETAATLPGFVAAGVMDGEGMLLDGYAADPNFQMENAAATFITLVAEAKTAGRFLSLGGPAELQLTYPGTFVLLRPITGTEGELVIGVAAKTETPLGRVRLAVNLLHKKILGAARRAAAEPAVAANNTKPEPH